MFGSRKSDQSQDRVKKKKNFNLETWMGDLPDVLRMRPLSKLAIPGSHHCMSFGIDWTSPLAGDFVAMRKRGWLKLFARFFTKKVLVRWSRVQAVDLTTQLCLGIRYFDMRVEYDENSKTLWSIHMMKSNLIRNGLIQINHFLQLHPREVVILDLQHLVGFPKQAHARLKHELKSTFGDKLCPGSFKLGKLSLDGMHVRGFQVIVVYRAIVPDNDFSRGCFFPIVYNRSESSSAHISSIEALLALPWPEKWFLIVHMTHKPSQLSSRLFSDAHSYAKSSLKHTRILTDSLEGSSTRPTVFVADFIHIFDAEFPKMVVNLNYSGPELIKRVTERKKKKKVEKYRQKALSSPSLSLRRFSSI